MKIILEFSDIEKLRQKILHNKQKWFGRLKGEKFHLIWIQIEAISTESIAAQFHKILSICTSWNFLSIFLAFVTLQRNELKTFVEIQFA